MTSSKDPSHLHDGPARLARFLAANKKSSIVDYAQEKGRASLDELADALLVAPIVVQMRYEEEARKVQDPRRLAEDLLARRILNADDGWPSEPGWDTLKDIRYHVIAWCAMMKDTAFEDAQDKICHRLLSSALPPGWRPEASHDPVIAALFDEFWKAG